MRRVLTSHAASVKFPSPPTPKEKLKRPTPILTVTPSRPSRTQRWQAAIGLLAALCVSALNGACQPNPNATGAGPNAPNPRAQGPGNDAVAVINEAQAGAKGTFPITAPLTMPLKDTAYPVPAGALFVSPQGKASSSGTSPNAPTTLQNALKIAPVGGTIVLRGGTYRVGGINLPRRLTLQSFAGEKPWLKGSVEVEGWVRDGDAWRHDNWQIEFPSRGYVATVLDKVTDPQYPMAPYGDMAFVDGKALFQVGSRAQVGPGRFYVDYRTQKLYLGDDPTGKMVEAASKDQGLFIGGDGDLARTAAGSMVRGLGLAHYQLGVNVSAPQVVIEDCTFLWNANNGLNLRGASTDCIVRGNTFTGNGSTGISANGAHRLLVEGNLISYNNVEGFKRTWSAAGVKVVLLDGFVARDNIAEHNFATGIWLDVDVNHAVVTRNISRYNGAIGIFFEISKHAVIAFNLVHDNGAGIQISGSHDAHVYNNTLVNNNRNFVMQQGNRKNSEKSGEVANTPTGEFFTARGNVFKNNIVWNSKAKAEEAMFDFRMWGQTPESSRSALMVAASAHNAYHRVTPTQPPAIIRWAANGKDFTAYQSAQEFSQATGYETGSLSTTGADPYFVDAEKGDFRLKPGSPARGIEEELPAEVAKALGVEGSRGRNLGAL